MSRRVRIAPSILSADMGHLAAEIADVERAGADWIHFDVADGHYAPTLTFGPIILQAARKATRLPLDVHLMIDEPERSVEAFARAGADHITVHGEATRTVERTLQLIRALGKRAGIALSPNVPVSTIENLLPSIDLVLMLCVSPGFSGQPFAEAQLIKIEQARALIDHSGRAIDLEVDGGVAPDNAERIRAAGATVLVSGSKIFGARDRRAVIESLRGAAHGDD
jgi:ribulose-phosphate 3-epimerase